MLFRLSSILFLFFLLNTNHVSAQLRDPYFGINGFIKQNIEGYGYDKGIDVLIQNDQKILSVGSAAEHPIYGDDIVPVIRYQYDGSLDTTFGDSGIVYLKVNNYSQTFYYDMALQSDQKMIIGGQYSTNRFLLRLNQDGSLDSSFASYGIYDFPDDDYYRDYFMLTILEEDKILVFRRFQETSLSEYEHEFIRFSTDGVLDTAFGDNGVFLLDLSADSSYFLSDFMITDDNAYLVNGRATNTDEFGNEFNEHVLIRFTEEVLIDSTFGENGYAYDDALNLSDMDLQSDGKIVCAGTVNLNPQGTVGAISVSRFTEDGFIDSTFGGDGHATVDIGVYADYANAVSIQDDGKILIGGSFFNFSGGSVTDCMLARFNQDGTIDNSFGEDGVFKLSLSSGTDIITEMVLHGSNKIVYVGYANYASFDIITGRVILDDLTASPDTGICFGDSATLYAYSDSLIIGWASEYEPDILLSTGDSLTVSPDTSTRYFVYGISDTASVNVSIIEIPSITLIPDSSLCEGESLFIDATYPNATYLWQDSSANASFNASESGSYYVTVSNDCGSASDSVQVTFNPLPIIDLGPDLFLCEGNEYDLDAFYPGATYLWQDSSSTSTFTVLEEGSYVVNLFLENCSFTDSIDAFYAAPSSSFLELTACDSLLSLSGDLYYTESGIYMDTLTNAAGCDSLITIDLSLNNSTYNEMMISACESYTAADGTTYITSGSYEIVLASQAGCDSILSLDLTIINLDAEVIQTGITLTAQSENLNYQWLDCNADFAAIEGENGQSFTAQSNGSYAVEISDGNCSMISDCFDITSVGINAIVDGNAISIYPNPTSDHLTIDIKKPEGSFINILSTHGEVLYFKEILNEITRIDLSGFAKAIYHLQILNEDQVLLYSESILLR